MSKHLQPLYSWIALYENDANERVQGALKSYSILKDEAKKLANFGVNEAFKRAERRNVRLRASNHIDAVGGAFAQRWLRNVSYYESLRVVLDTSTVNPLLASLDSEQRELLKWRYTEQSTDDEVATLFIFLDSRSRSCSELARAKSQHAYDLLCDLVEQSLKKTGKELNHWDKQYRFPKFPGVCLDHKPRC